MVMKKSILTIGSVFACVLGGASLSSAAVLTPLLPQTHTYHGIPYVSGGVGLDERAALREMTAQDNLKLSFALKNRDYLSDVNVVIVDHQGNKVLEAASNGPWLFTALPAGTYTIRATTLGETLEQEVHVSSKGQTPVYFVWRDSVGQGAFHSLTKR
jgi:hypothetical protein